MHKNDFIENYLYWLKSNMTEITLENGIIEITTPFLDRNNDYTQIYIERKDNSYILTDNGYIIDELIMIGVDINTPKRQEIIKKVLNRYGVFLDGELLKIECTLEDYPIKKHNLLQAMLAIDDIFYLSRPNVVSIFYEEVENYLESNDIRYSPDINFIGKAGYSHSFEFVIPKSKKMPERMIKIANNITKSLTESIIFAWNDTRLVRPKNSLLYTFINDKNKIQGKYIDALRKYEIIPIMWSERDNYINQLAS